MNCIFCKIAAKELPANFIYEDERTLAFDDMYPKAPIHKLIIPKQHIATLNDIKENDIELAGYLLYAAQKVATKLDIADHGYRIVMNCNKGGGQEVFHIHLHLLAVPKASGEKLKF